MVGYISGTGRRLDAVTIQRRRFRTRTSLCESYFEHTRRILYSSGNLVKGRVTRMKLPRWQGDTVIATARPAPCSVGFRRIRPIRSRERFDALVIFVPGSSRQQQQVPDVAIVTARGDSYRRCLCVSYSRRSRADRLRRDARTADMLLRKSGP